MASIGFSVFQKIAVVKKLVMKVLKKIEDKINAFVDLMPDREKIRSLFFSIKGMFKELWLLFRNNSKEVIVDKVKEKI